LIFLMELVSSIISFIMAYFALRAYQTTGVKGLLLLYLGFLILGVGTMLRFLTATYVGIILREYPDSGTRLGGLIGLTVTIYVVTQLVAYGFFAVTYILQAVNSVEAHKEAVTAVVAAVAIPLAKLFFIPGLEIIAIALLGFITASTFANWLLKKGTAAALVFLGFGLMLLSHVFFLFMAIEEWSIILLVLGQITQLAGFICLLIMLARVGKPNAERT